MQVESMSMPVSLGERSLLLDARSPDLNRQDAGTAIPFVHCGDWIGRAS